MVRLAHYDALHYVVLFLDHEMVYLANFEVKSFLIFYKHIFCVPGEYTLGLRGTGCAGEAGGYPVVPASRA